MSPITVDARHQVGEHAVWQSNSGTRGFNPSLAASQAHASGFEVPVRDAGLNVFGLSASDIKAYVLLFLRMSATLSACLLTGEQLLRSMSDDKGHLPGSESGTFSKMSQHWKGFAEATPEEHKK